MKTKLRLLIVVATMVIVVFALNVGVAFAHPDANPNFQGDHPDDPHPSPVGQNLSDSDFPGKFLGFDTGNATAGITHNPNCPLHHH